MRLPTVRLTLAPRSPSARGSRRSIAALAAFAAVAVLLAPVSEAKGGKATAGGKKGGGSAAASTSSSWSVATTLGTGRAPQVASDGSGGAVAVWEDAGAVRASRHVAGTGWTSAVRLDTGTAGAYHPDVAMDASGAAIAVWTSDKQIRATRYDAATGWGAPQSLNPAGLKGAWNPKVAMDDAGHAVVVWEEVDPQAVEYPFPFSGWLLFLTTIRASTALDGLLAGRWSPPVVIDEVASPTPFGYSRDARVAMDAQGDAVAVWFRGRGTFLTGGHADVLSNRLVDGRWQSAEAIESVAHWSDQPQVSINAAGRMAAVWYEIGNSTTVLGANSGDVRTGWEGGVVLPTARWSGYPEVGVDGSGAATAVFVQNETGPTDVATSRSTDGTWSASQVVDATRKDTREPHVAVNAAGAAVAAWYQDGSLAASRYSTSTGWGTPSVVGTGTPGYFLQPDNAQLALGGDGAATLVWVSDAGDVLASRSTAP